MQGNLKTRKITLQGTHDENFGLEVLDDTFHIKRGNVSLMSVSRDEESMLTDDNPPPTGINITADVTFEGNVTIDDKNVIDKLKKVDEELQMDTKQYDSLDLSKANTLIGPRVDLVNKQEKFFTLPSHSYLEEPYSNRIKSATILPKISYAESDVNRSLFSSGNALYPVSIVLQGGKRNTLSGGILSTDAVLDIPATSQVELLSFDEKSKLVKLCNSLSVRFNEDMVSSDKIYDSSGSEPVTYRDMVTKPFTDYHNKYFSSAEELFGSSSDLRNLIEEGADTFGTNNTNLYVGYDINYDNSTSTYTNYLTADSFVENYKLSDNSNVDNKDKIPIITCGKNTRKLDNLSSLDGTYSTNRGINSYDIVNTSNETKSFDLIFFHDIRYSYASPAGINIREFSANGTLKASSNSSSRWKNWYNYDLKYKSIFLGSEYEFLYDNLITRSSVYKTMLLTPNQVHSGREFGSKKIYLSKPEDLGSSEPIDWTSDELNGNFDAAPPSAYTDKSKLEEFKNQTYYFVTLEPGEYLNMTLVQGKNLYSNFDDFIFRGVDSFAFSIVERTPRKFMYAYPGLDMRDLSLTENEKFGADDNKKSVYDNRVEISCFKVDYNTDTKGVIDSTANLLQRTNIVVNNEESYVPKNNNDYGYQQEENYNEYICLGTAGENIESVPDHNESVVAKIKMSQPVGKITVRIGVSTGPFEAVRVHLKGKSTNNKYFDCVMSSSDNNDETTYELSKLSSNDTEYDVLSSHTLYTYNGTPYLNLKNTQYNAGYTKVRQEPHGWPNSTSWSLSSSYERDDSIYNADFMFYDFVFHRLDVGEEIYISYSKDQSSKARHDAVIFKVVDVIDPGFLVVDPDPFRISIGGDTGEDVVSFASDEYNKSRQFVNGKSQHFTASENSYFTLPKIFTNGTIGLKNIIGSLEYHFTFNDNSKSEELKANQIFTQDKCLVISNNNFNNFNKEVTFNKNVTFNDEIYISGLKSGNTLMRLNDIYEQLQQLSQVTSGTIALNNISEFNFPENSNLPAPLGNTLEQLDIDARDVGFVILDTNADYVVSSTKTDHNLLYPISSSSGPNLYFRESSRTGFYLNGTEKGTSFVLVCDKNKDFPIPNDLVNQIYRSFPVVPTKSDAVDNKKIVGIADGYSTVLSSLTKPNNKNTNKNEIYSTYTWISFDANHNGEKIIYPNKDNSVIYRFLASTQDHLRIRVGISVGDENSVRLFIPNNLLDPTKNTNIFIADSVSDSDNVELAKHSDGSPYLVSHTLERDDSGMLKLKNKETGEFENLSINKKQGVEGDVSYSWYYGFLGGVPSVNRWGISGHGDDKDFIFLDFEIKTASLIIENMCWGEPDLDNSYNCVIAKPIELGRNISSVSVPNLSLELGSNTYSVSRNDVLSIKSRSDSLPVLKIPDVYEGEVKYSLTNCTLNSSSVKTSFVDDCQFDNISFKATSDTYKTIKSLHDDIENLKTQVANLSNA